MDLRKLSPLTQPQKRTLLYGSGAVLVVLAGVIILHKSTAKKVPQEPRREVITYSTSNPSEVADEIIAQKWKGPATDPFYIRIPSRSIEGPIQAVGVDQNGAIAVPSNIHAAGWYVDSRLPGESGNSVITGHVDGRTMPGIFSTLSSLQKGDEIEIENGSGNKQYFTVTEKITVPESEAIPTLFNQDPGIYSQLSLISCIGKLDPVTKRYEDRVIIRAVKNISIKI